MGNEIVYIKKINNSLRTIDALYGQKSIGYISYKIENGDAWLYKVTVNPDYRNHGVGGALLKIMEDECASRRVWNIEGKYYPEGASNEEVKNFYIKHGFNIYKEGYETFVGKWSPTKQDLNGLNIKEEIIMER